VDAITKTAAHIDPARLSTRVPVAGDRDEVDRLAEVINGMLERIAEGFKRERRFASHASHELRTPLTTLRGEMEVALRRSRSPEEYLEVIRRGLSEVERMGRIVDGLLFLARADSGHVRLEHKEIDLAHVLVRSAEIVRRHHEAADIRVPTSADPAMTVMGRRDLLERLFVNLVENGLMYGAEPIQVEVEDGGMFWEVSVADAGPGLSEESIPHLFDRFYRGEQSRGRASGGAGLGLAICAWIAESHGGRITARNDPRGGAVFVVALPKMQQKP
jgi:signal transduction histidine kinase